MTLKLGVLLPTRGLVMGSAGPSSIEPLLSMAEQAEQAGLDSVWVGDSLTAKPRLEPLTTLAAIAMRTKKVRLGTAVMLAALRHPVQLAQMSATVDTISGGRLILGAGVGGAFNDAQQQEWLNVGVKPSQRARRFEEVLEIATRLTRGEAVTFEGRHFNFNEVSVQPRAVQTNGVPFLVACHWRAGRERQFQRAARLGAGFMSISDYPDDYARVVDRVRGYTAEYGGDPESPEATFYMTVNLREDETAAADEADKFLHQYYGSNIWGDRWGPFGNPQRVAERIAQYHEAGAQTVIVRFASFEQERQLDTFLHDIIPSLG